VLLHAVAALKRTLPVRLILVGDGEERATLEALVSRLDLGNDVRFVGWQANPWALLARSDVLALSSRTEAFPSVITEAMALDIPVVATECSAGVRECVDDGSAGILVPPTNPAALATALGAILTQPEVAESLRRRGAVYVARFRLHDAAATYEDMLLDVLGRGTREAAEHRSEFTPRKDADVAVDA
jgi:glycosyltransferase involved in cell wall biosynthesis